MIRMLIVGYCFGIRSERRLCEEVHLNLAYRWFCRLGLEGDVPDHSTFSKNRHCRFRDSDLLRELFETTVRRCIEEGLVGGEGFAVDANLINADANSQRSAKGTEPVDWKAMAETRRSVQEYIDSLDDAAWGAASEVKPKFVSRSDPAAQWTGAMKGHAFFGYAANYLIDMDHAVIVDVEASRALRQAEVGAANDHRAHAGPLWPLAGTARRRQRLRVGRQSRLACPRPWDRAAHPGLRQVRAEGRHLRTGRPPMTIAAISILARVEGTATAPEDLPDAAPSRR